MKTLPALTVIAALVAFISLPASFETTVSLLFVAGLALLISADYARVRPLPVAVAATVAPKRTERFGLAA